MAVVDVFTSPRPARSEARPQKAGVRLLDAVPALQEAVPAEDRQLARRVLLAPVRSCEPGMFTLPVPTGPGRPFGVIILEGSVFRETHLGDRAVAELLGPHDVIDTHRDDDACSLPWQTEYVVREATTVAILDDHFVLAARRWPTLHEVLGAQQARQVRRASRHLATLGLPRVEDRVMALFCELADRWGRVTPEGIRIDVPLTHALIGQLIGARRPTVSLALTELAASGHLRRQADKSWTLTRDVPMAA